MSIKHDVGGGWDVDVIEQEAVFVRYRGVDVVAVWLPCDGVRGWTSVTVPSVEQVADVAADPDGAVEFGTADETDIVLSEHVQAIAERR